jgi:excisionase family DNA binding protein
VETMQNGRELLRIADVAKELGVGKSTPYDWVRNGSLKALRLPTGTLRIARSDLEQFVRRGAEEKGRAR